MNIKLLSTEALSTELAEAQDRLNALTKELKKRELQAYREKLDKIVVQHGEGFYRFFCPDGFAMEAFNVGEGRRANQYSHYEIWTLRPAKRGEGYVRASKIGGVYATFQKLREMAARKDAK